MTNSPRRCGLADGAGFSLLEIVIVVGIIGVLAAMAVPALQNEIGYLRVSGDARSVSNAVALAKLKAASNFSQVRLYADLSSNTFWLQTKDKTSTYCCWTTTGGETLLSQGVTFNFDIVGTPPPNTQTSIAQASKCKDASGMDIANTACIIFNSRGAPIDASGSPMVGFEALYVTDRNDVYGVTLSATGMSKSWQTLDRATPAWVQQ